jgi:C-terminal processing protease CtpA/Prc
MSFSGPKELYKLKIIPVDKKEKALFENDSLSHSWKLIGHKGHQFSYIRLWWLSGWTMRQVLELGIMAARSEGIIIDIRDGFGSDPPTEYIQPFLRDGLDTITEESIGRNRTFTSTPAFNKPVIVVINGGSRSGKELLAYYFKKTKRGLLIGERTAGYVSAGRWKRISQGSMLYYCVMMIIVDGKRLEGVGVEPDIEVPFDVRFAAGRDIQLERAKDEMVKLIEVIANSSFPESQFKSNTTPPLGFLKTRKGIIRLESGGKFSILDSGGKPIALFLNRAELRVKFPQLYEAFETAIADSKGEAVIIDASMNMP